MQSSAGVPVPLPRAPLGSSARLHPFRQNDAVNAAVGAFGFDFLTNFGQRSFVFEFEFDLEFVFLLVFVVVFVLVCVYVFVLL